MSESVNDPVSIVGKPQFTLIDNRTFYRIVCLVHTIKGTVNGYEKFILGEQLYILS